MDRDELGAWLRLATTPGIGNQTARKLLATFGLPTALFAQNRGSAEPVRQRAPCTRAGHGAPSWPELLEKTWQWLHASDLAEGTARAIITLGMCAIPRNCSTPRTRRSCSTWWAPALWCKVSPSPKGAAWPWWVAETLRRKARTTPTNLRRHWGHRLTIVSGLALGVDAAAHEGALAPIAPDRSLKEGDAPTTIAVVGTGLDRVYPSRHLDLAHRIARHGLLVSEYPLGTPGPQLSQAQPHHFRPVAGTLVVEAALASGSLITARLATEQGREVFAIPGSIHAPAIPGLLRPHQTRGQAGGVCTRRAGRMPLGATGRQLIHG